MEADPATRVCDKLGMMENFEKAFFSEFLSDTEFSTSRIVLIKKGIWRR